MPADPTLDEKIAAVRDAIASTEDAPDGWYAAMRAVLATLEASRPAPLPDGEPTATPKGEWDDSRLYAAERRARDIIADLGECRHAVCTYLDSQCECAQVAHQIANLLNTDDGTKDAERLAETLFLQRSIVTQSDLIKRLTQERDAVTRRAEALEAEVAGLNKILQESFGLGPFAVPPVADHTERAREIYRAWLGDRLLSALMVDDIAAALIAAERAGAEKMRERAAVFVETHVEGNHDGVPAVSPKAGIARGSLNGRAYATAIRGLPLPGEE